MFTMDESGYEISGRRPACLAGPEAEAKRLAAWTAAWETRMRCCGVTRAGVQCKNQPMRGRLTCRRHGPAGSSRHPLKKPPTALAEHAREMRRLWRADPWATGHTVELDREGQERLEAWTAGAGIRWDWLSPHVQDFARWAYVNSCRSGRHPDDDARASDTLAERIRGQQWRTAMIFGVDQRELRARNKPGLSDNTAYSRWSPRRSAAGLNKYRQWPFLPFYT